MPGLGKSGTSRINCFRWSQLITDDFDVELAGDGRTTRLLRYGMMFLQVVALLRTPAPHRRAKRAAPVAVPLAREQADRRCRWQGPQPRLRRCCAPIPQPQSRELLSQRTSG